MSQVSRYVRTFRVVRRERSGIISAGKSLPAYQARQAERIAAEQERVEREMKQLGIWDEVEERQQKLSHRRTES